MRILISGAWQGYKDCREELLSMGHEIQFLQWEKDPLPCEPTWPEAIIGNGIFLHHSIEQFTNLRYIQITSAGYDRVPMDYVREHDITIYNARGVYSIPMAEFALGAVLQLYKQFPTFCESQKKHEWNKIRNIRELNKSTVCIIGCGSVGTECAKRFKAFNCRVEGIDLYPNTNDFYDQMESLEHIDEAIMRADILIVTVPLTEATKNLLSRERIASLKNGATIVNIARGGVLDYDAFIELKEEKNLAAVLDVFPEEPLVEDSVLWDMEDVIVTPHNSFQGEWNMERLNEVILDNINNYKKK